MNTFFCICSRKKAVVWLDWLTTNVLAPGRKAGRRRDWWTINTFYIQHVFRPMFAVRGCWICFAKRRFPAAPAVKGAVALHVPTPASCVAQTPRHGEPQPSLPQQPEAPRRSTCLPPSVGGPRTFLPIPELVVTWLAFFWYPKLILGVRPCATCINKKIVTRSFPHSLFRFLSF